MLADTLIRSEAGYRGQVKSNGACLGRVLLSCPQAYAVLLQSHTFTLNMQKTLAASYNFRTSFVSKDGRQSFLCVSVAEKNLNATLSNIMSIGPSSATEANALCASLYEHLIAGDAQGCFK